MGESGCGKSVTALSIMRLFPSPPGRFSGGEILFKGRDIIRVPLQEMRKVRGCDICMIFQEPMTSFMRLALKRSSCPGSKKPLKSWGPRAV